jgi:hypothetical protein
MKTINKFETERDKKRERETQLMLQRELADRLPECRFHRVAALNFRVADFNWKN